MGKGNTKSPSTIPQQKSFPAPFPLRFAHGSKARLLIVGGAGSLFWLVRTIFYCKDYGKVTLDISKNVIQSRSLSKGISKFIVDEYPLVTLTYAGIDIAANYFSALKEIPRLNELVKLFIQNFWKRLALFAGIMTFYTVTVYWVIKPIIIRQYF